ncbi:hypothetical protein [Vibrio vulnificus]|uniref:hypothetical protein n=1 Tax=Vibrio vulnificus TaxID=672 RepID=UPI0019D41FB1|nr:hypothetical protein [Vibrio vulnificus]EJT0555638.1 hypothetical protein [Vibrio vulnificus]MBN8133603.1 hypothetical protein [Vibrio vulnificus]MBN8138414.1 hypothetical protein [Vibrio vulnificus]MBN8161430.1 hypothetical protein [Vibrio vulnificus]
MTIEKMNVALSATTDWPTVLVTGAIGIGSIMTSIAVAWITHNNQMIQNKSKVAELRQKWLEALRQEIAEYSSLCLIIGANYHLNEKFFKTPECSQLFRELYKSHSNLVLMMEQDKDYTLIIRSMMDDIRQSLDSKEPNKMKDLNAMVGALNEQANSLLEKAWKDIKRDLLK